jgi:hypothetical protein
MYDGAGYVIAAYAVMALMFAVWFAMIIRRLRLTAREEREEHLDG